MCTAPSSPSTTPTPGSAAIFISKLLNGEAPVIFGDGMQTRDFTHVSDIVQAIGLAQQADCPSDTYNVGTGVQTSILELAHLLARELSFTGPGPSGQVRAGDIIHCVGDITRISQVLGYRPRVALAEGVGDLIAWARQQQATLDPAKGDDRCSVRLAQNPDTPFRTITRALKIAHLVPEGRPHVIEIAGEKVARHTRSGIRDIS
jgi:hypothetical protein